MINVILWDFDGVILDSMHIRELGFQKTLTQFPQHEVDELLSYHRRNGGLSRYVKFRYFFEKIRGTSITESEVLDYAERFSVIMKELLLDEALLIMDTVSFIQQNHQRYQMHIVSGSDQTELRYLCEKHQLSSYFHSINGSPTPKTELVSAILKKHQYPCEEVILIGDSTNDFQAAEANSIGFYAYNNELLKNDFKYIESFTAFQVNGLKH